MIYAASFVGEKKTTSEDSVLVGDTIVVNSYREVPLPQKGFVCVADGVGGNNAGEVASAFVLEALKNYDGIGDLKAFVQTVNEKLLQKSKEQPEFDRMATTLTGIYIDDEKVSLVHIGNTRAYLSQSKYLKQLTDDHTLYRLLQTTGRTEEAEHCNRSVITNCMGGGDKKYIERLSVSELSMFSRILLTSDGVHDFVSTDELETIVNERCSEKEKCERMIQLARESGSKDDITAVLIVR